jgi:hypothetical protein
VEMVQLILVVAVVELEFQDQMELEQAVQESLLLDTNFKINMYLLTFKINI